MLAPAKSRVNFHGIGEDPLSTYSWLTIISYLVYVDLPENSSLFEGANTALLQIVADMAPSFFLSRTLAFKPSLCNTASYGR